MTGLAYAGARPSWQHASCGWRVFLGASLAAVLLPGVAPAQSPEATVEKTAAAEPPGAAAPDPKTPDPSELSAEEKNLEKLWGMYGLATRVVGRPHVIVTAAAFAGQRCGMGNDIFSCSAAKENHGGIGGVILVPIFGAGGGHGADFWPVIETDQTGDGFYQFDKQFRRLRDLLASRLDLPDEKQERDEDLLRRFNLLAGVFAGELTRYEDRGAYTHEAKNLHACLDLLSTAPVRPRGTEDVTPNPRPSRYCQDGASAKDVGRGWTMPEKVKLLSALWREFDLIVDAAPVARHVLLVGPLAGLSLTDKFGDFLYGAGLELGTRQTFRLTVAGGLRSASSGRWYYGNMDAVGWWVGLGLSGQMGDQLIDGLLGVNHIFSAAASESQ